jgi:hypothetical protein
MGDGMQVIREIYTGYADSVDQQAIWRQGYTYLRDEFPELDYIGTCARIGSSRDEL